MEPPICSLCDRDQRDSPELAFDLVQFADYEPLDRPGHPKGLLWFCEAHLAAARKQSHLPAAEALRRIRHRSWLGRLRDLVFRLDPKRG